MVRLAARAVGRLGLAAPAPPLLICGAREDSHAESNLDLVGPWPSPLFPLLTSFFPYFFSRLQNKQGITRFMHGGSRRGDAVGSIWGGGWRRRTLDPCEQAARGEVSQIGVVVVAYDGGGRWR